MTLKDDLRSELLHSGAVAVGFASAGNIPDTVSHQYEEWLTGGNHAGMEYLTRHLQLRRNPENMLGNVATVISVAYSHAPARRRDDSLPGVAPYAYGEDYHDVLRRRLSEVVERMRDKYGGDWRICIDSAPLPERYWAIACGIGRRSINGSVIVDGFGSYIFLTEILTSHFIEPDTVSGATSGSIMCLECKECLRVCPTGALKGDGTLDARRCLNYLTIEHRGEWTPEGREAMQTPAGRHTLFGCDLCQRICPYNRDIPPTDIHEFYPRPGMITNEDSPLNTPEGVISLTQNDFSHLFKGSPIKRVKLAGLIRNALNLRSPDGLCGSKN